MLLFTTTVVCIYTRSFEIIARSELLAVSVLRNGHILSVLGRKGVQETRVDIRLVLVMRRIVITLAVVSLTLRGIVIDEIIIREPQSSRLEIALLSI